jgi:hypothetical protein
MQSLWGACGQIFHAYLMKKAAIQQTPIAHSSLSRAYPCRWTFSSFFLNTHIKFSELAIPSFFVPKVNEISARQAMEYHVFRI